MRKGVVECIFKQTPRRNSHKASDSLVLGVEVCFGGGWVGFDGQYLWVLGGTGHPARLPVLVVPVLSQQSDAGQRDTHEDDDKHSTWAV